MSIAELMQAHIRERAAELEYLKIRLAQVSAEQDQLTSQANNLDDLIRGMKNTLSYLKRIEPDNAALADVEPAAEIPF